jgi:potassium-transporting ATPase KdpC subunit
MALRKDIITSAIGMLVLTLVCGIAYPLVVTGVSQVAFPGNANGQKVYVGGKLVGSKIIGQNFATQVYKNGKPETSDGNPVTTPDPMYFQTRPSGTTPADNDAATTFANYGPNSTITEQAIASNISTYLQLNCATTLTKSGSCSQWYDPKVTGAGDVPVDAADTSASGVDPDISVANADIQAYRIASLHHLSLPTVDSLISQYTAGRGLGFSGEPAVNVLEMNLALDRIHS